MKFCCDMFIFLYSYAKFISTDLGVPQRLTEGTGRIDLCVFDLEILRVSVTYKLLLPQDHKLGEVKDALATYLAAMFIITAWYMPVHACG